MDDPKPPEIVLVGCGFMGQALLRGWLANGIEPGSITIRETSPSEWLSSQTHLRTNEPIVEYPTAVVFAVKPHLLNEILPTYRIHGGGPTVFVSVAAGYPIGGFERALGSNTPIVRAMPNLPVSVSTGVTALFANGATTSGQLAIVQRLFETVGTVVRLSDESEMHAVTALSGSGPAYIFALVEAMSRAGIAYGLAPDIAVKLAQQTAAGAGQMLKQPGSSATELRQAVSSPGGTTAAGLSELLDETNGISPLIARTIEAARRRSEELSS